MVPGPVTPSMPAPRHTALRLGLLAVWVLASFGVMYWARDLQSSVLGWPFSFWFGAQGAVLVFIAIVAVYAFAANRADARAAADAAQPPRP